ncbi:MULTISPECIES: 2'-5' RNA ligase family protein [unclassified Luteimonas]
MSRTLFTAWRPDVADQAALSGPRDRIVAARPQDAPRLSLRRPDQWHITLCFVARELDEAVLEATRDALDRAAAAIPPHAFTIGRVAFWRHSGAVVALPHRNDTLQALCDAHRDALRRGGIRPEETTTQPHVTLAYLERGSAPQPWLDEVDCASEALRVERFELLFNAGGRYQALGTWALRGAALPQQAQLL